VLVIIKNAFYYALSKIFYQRFGESKIMVKKRKNDDSIWDIITGLALGFSGLMLLSLLKKPECPNCRSKIDRGITKCTNCGVPLEWNKKY
jgi:DNA-directed RNA polymerase subunit RPC12/RpoP